MRKCEICGQDKFSLIATKIREGKGRIIRCNHCNLVTQDLDWTKKKLRKYYEAEYQTTNSLVAGRKQTAEEHFQHRLQTIQPLFEQIRPLLNGVKRLLEVGCGPGALLSLCKPLVNQCIGVEFNSEFVDYMNTSLNIEAYAQDVRQLRFKEKFDLIIMISTLDHLPNPLGTLITLKNRLSPKGKIYIEVPNLNEALNKYLPEPHLASYRKFFWHRAHFFYFSKETITSLFHKADLEIEATCRHDYTLKNYLQWYFTGQPQFGIVEGMSKKIFFNGNSEFETRMNSLFLKAENEFKKIMSETFSGDSLCCLGWPRFHSRGKKMPIENALFTRYI